MRIWRRMRLCPFLECRNQSFEPVFITNVCEVRAVLPQVAEKGRRVCCYPLSDHGHAEPVHRQRLGFVYSIEPVAIIRSCFPESIELVCRPEIRSFLLDELSREIHPIEVLETWRNRDRSKASEPSMKFRLRQAADCRELPLDNLALNGKTVVVIDQFA